jgi:hypothetical protein
MPISITLLNTDYTQDFNTLATTGTSGFLPPNRAQPIPVCFASINGRRHTKLGDLRLTGSVATSAPTQQ